MTALPHGITKMERAVSGRGLSFAYDGELRPAVTPTTRPEALDRLRSETFDVLIIGGGINGAGTARDLALRAKTANIPFRIALVDQSHFGSGTSGKNSHLIHGGLRYLKQLDIHLVREALHERTVLLKIAPHLVEPLPFLLPIAGLGREIYYHLGLTVYDGFSRGFPRHRRLSLRQVHDLEPGLAAPGMTAAAEYYDAQVRSARLVLENVFEAIRNGAACANYVRVESHVHDGDWRIQLHDSIEDRRFEARARTVIDATGPWAQDPAPRLVRGSHIVFPRLNASDHAVAYFEESGRIIFFIPWGERRDRTLVGTTDVDHAGSADSVQISGDEIAYLRNIAAQVFPESSRLEPVATFSSLRPLLVSSGSATKATREHRIFFDSNGILRITGGKFTTYRAMAEEAADLLAERIAPGLKNLHVTSREALNGNTAEAIGALRTVAAAMAAKGSEEASEINLLVSQYGVLAHAVLEGMNEPTPPGMSKIDAARMKFAIDHEMAQYPNDFLEVSTTLAHEGRGNILPDGVWPPRKSLQ